eukprot:TRINITY_DN20871_c0_g1_i3.p1 TRINITY_DN20871_c0_g1~~TRINITY_DN20871_c0_g1_i3.p1  ORF type:complete len:411 (+),score=227.74 TRINITY_DN20871_c0_g1_i3:48-1280(+)
MSTIRFEDLGRPIQQLLKSLKDGYNDADMALMEFVSVKDMAKIYDDLNSSKKAELIWKELRRELKERRQQILAKELEETTNKQEMEKIQELIRKAEEEEAEHQRQKEEKKRQKKERREQREKERREREEQAEREMREEEEKAKQLDEEAAEKARRRAQKKKEKKRLEEERLAQEAAEAEAEAERAAEEEAKAKEERRKTKKKEIAELKAKEEDLRQRAEANMKEQAKSKARNLKEEWDKFVKDHPLEYGDAEEEIVQVDIGRSTRPPPKEFLKVKQIRIPEVEDKEEAAFFKLDIRLHSGGQKFVQRRYNQFVELKSKLGSTLEVLEAQFPGKTFTRLRGAGLDKRRLELEVWINDVIQKLSSARSYAGITLDAKQQLRGDAARAEAERQRMAQAGVAKLALHQFADISE